MIPGRKAWQCRERFTRHVDPRIDHENGWTWEEDVTLVKAVKRAGTYAWIAIAKKYFPRRTDVMCMRRYKMLLTWKKQQQWISHLDPDVKRYHCFGGALLHFVVINVKLLLSLSILI